MDLWIRSQDKRHLKKVDYIVAAGDKDDEMWSIEEKVINLGRYSKERALEVLDEINKIKYYKYMASLDWGSFIKSISNTYPDDEKQKLLSMMNTYEMPKE